MIIKQLAVIKINNRRKYIHCDIETKDDQLISINTREFSRSKRNIKFLTNISIGSKVKFRILTETKVYTGVGIISWKTMTNVCNEPQFKFEISKFRYVNCKERVLESKRSFQNTLDMFKDVWYNEMTRRIDQQFLESLKS